MLVAISKEPQLFKIEKEDAHLWAKFNGNFENVELSSKELLEKIALGHAYTTQHSKYRHTDWFVCGQHLGLDFDTEDVRSTIDFLKEDEFIKKYASFIHTTPSHTDIAPRARVVFVLEKAIRQADKYAELMEALITYKFRMVSDKSCKDPVRFFYGAKDCDSLYLGNILPLSVCAEEVVKPHRTEKEIAERERAEKIKKMIVAAPSEVPQDVLDKHSDKLLERVATASEYKHYELRNIAMTFGGYVASGYYDQNDVILWLKNAIRQNPNNVESYPAADKTIENSLVYGMARPLYFDNKYFAEEIPETVKELDNVHPPLTLSQKVQVSEIIKVKEWEAYVENRKRTNVELPLDKFILDKYNIGYRSKTVEQDTGEILPSAITVPYYYGEDVVAMEFRTEEGVFEYNGEVGLYEVKPIINEECNYGIILPDSLLSISSYLSGDGHAKFYGMPHTTIATTLPDVQLYCLFEEESENLDILDRHGVKFIRLRNVDSVVRALTRKEIERLAISGRKLKEIL